MKPSILFGGLLSNVVFGVLVVTTPSCTDESIVLATLSAGPDGGASPEAGDAALVPPSNSCTDNTSCPAGTFCSKTSCTAATGSCARIPDAGECTAQPFAVACGCEDGVSYYNDCLRRAHAVSFGVPGVCGSDNQMVCSPDGTFKCTDPTTQKCFVQPVGVFGGGGGGGKPTDCPSPAYPGTCWVIPSVCPAAPDGSDRYDLCGNGQRGCVDTCEAVASGVASRRDSSCGSNPHGN